ncbi:hypothetical protein BDR05DRAFT_972469 [Suillus weaverae]|nr:hypothetical protein BDR05DRAFT_972469 [Suillus weaverae]
MSVASVEEVIDEEIAPWQRSLNDSIVQGQRFRRRMTLLTLANHPNPLFIQSVCQGLHEGFWPWADTQVGIYPTTWDIPSPTPSSKPQRAFLYSKNFGPDLFPGMYSMLIHAVPKEGGKYCLVTNHSMSEFSLNSMIAKEDIVGVTLDNVQDLGDAIHEYHHLDPNGELLIWKADVSEAYRHMLMHSLWQIKQVVSFEANIFGGHASQCIFHAFMSLVIWIAAFIYVDDSFSFARFNNLSFYVKYRKMLPTDMVTLLLLWDELGIPHEERKQVFGSPLPVIRFEVDPNLMKISLKEDSKQALVQELCSFARYKQKQSLRDSEHIAGSLNWALNICPHLCPGLSALYAKTKGKTNSKGMLWINHSIIEELQWAAYLLEHSDEIYLVKLVSWPFLPLPSNVLEVFCDASGSGMGFWYPYLNLGFQSGLPEHSPIQDIFFEALCVASAIHDAVTQLPLNRHLAMYMDSLNSVYMFNSLAGEPGFNQILMDIVEVILAFDVDFHVFHISGWRIAEAMHTSPGLHILPFQPP